MKITTIAKAQAALHAEMFRLDPHDHSWFRRCASITESVTLHERKFNGKPARRDYEMRWYVGGQPGQRWCWRACETIKEAVAKINEVAAASDAAYAEAP